MGRDASRNGAELFEIGADFSAKIVTFGLVGGDASPPLNPPLTPRTSLHKTSAFKSSNGANDKFKPPPVCFVCSKPDAKHFLMDCEIFKGSFT